MPTCPTPAPVQHWERHRHRDLEQIAVASLKCARLLMETGSRGDVIHKCCRLLADGLQAELIGVRVGYGSIAITLVSGANTITRMVTVGRHRVDDRLNQVVRSLITEAASTGMPAAEIVLRLDAAVASSPRYPVWLVTGAVGLACAAFGGLMNVDTAALIPILVAACAGQYLRQLLLQGGTNPYVVTAVTAFLASAACGVLARAAGSSSVSLAMLSAPLFLVPGVQATNAQADILDGSPTLGSARAVSVLMAMIFATTGIWIAQAMTGIYR